MTSRRIPPIERSVSVSWDPQTAFDRFTSQFASWWPVRSHSIGGDQVQRVVFECRAGGLIYEEHRHGRRFQWGQILAWEPPNLVKFTWHPSRDPATAQDVEIRFVAEGTGTRLTLIATGWERWGPKARLARNGYSAGWAYVLNVWAGRRTAAMLLLDAIAALLTPLRKLRGGAQASIARARGELPPP